MHNRFGYFKRSNGVYYALDLQTQRQTSLKTRSDSDAKRLIAAKNQTADTPQLNRALAKIYALAASLELEGRTWQKIMEAYAAKSVLTSRPRVLRAFRSEPFHELKRIKVNETDATTFWAVLNHERSGNSTIHYLRRLQNFALAMRWLFEPVIPCPEWPRIKRKRTIAISAEEHSKIIASELNAEHRCYYEMLWETAKRRVDISAGPDEGTFIGETYYSIDDPLLVLEGKRLEMAQSSLSKPSQLLLRKGLYSLTTRTFSNPENQSMKPFKKIVFTPGGKGGVGKTTVIVALAEWYAENKIPCTLLDLDTENKKKGSLAHFFPERAVKIDINTPAGLDAFVDHADEEPDIILADMGADSGKVASQWFDTMYESVADRLSFTALAAITSDPASVESLLSWAARLQDRVSYVVVLNQQEDTQIGFSYWDDTFEAKAFRELFAPAIIRMESRLPDLQHAMRNHGLTLGHVSQRQVKVAELSKSSLVIRAQAYRRQLFNEFARVKEALLP